MEPDDVKNLLWSGWIFNGKCEEIHASNMTIEETIQRSGVRALEDWLEQVNQFKFHRRWSADLNLEAISCQVQMHYFTERVEEVWVTVLGRR